MKNKPKIGAQIKEKQIEAGDLIYSATCDQIHYILKTEWNCVWTLDALGQSAGQKRRTFFGYSEKLVLVHRSDAR